MKQGIEWQVSNLELSQKLKELGVKQESLYFHIKDESEKIDRVHPANEIIQEYEVDEEYGSKYPTPLCVLNEESWSDWKEQSNIVSAYTVAELGEMLPEMTRSWNISNNWLCVSDLSVSCTSKQSDTEADARALMLIYLLENELITL